MVVHLTIDEYPHHQRNQPRAATFNGSNNVCTRYSLSST